MNNRSPYYHTTLPVRPGQQVLREVRAESSSQRAFPENRKGSARPDLERPELRLRRSRAQGPREAWGLTQAGRECQGLQQHIDRQASLSLVQELHSSQEQHTATSSEVTLPCKTLPWPASLWKTRGQLPHCSSSRSPTSPEAEGACLPLLLSTLHSHQHCQQQRGLAAL